MKSKLVQQHIFTIFLLLFFTYHICLCSSCTYIKVESAGYSDGRYARFSINNMVYSYSDSDSDLTYRGFNVCVLDSSSLSIITASSVFDTCEFPNENNSMKNFIDSYAASG